MWHHNTIAIPDFPVRFVAQGDDCYLHVENVVEVMGGTFLLPAHFNEEPPMADPYTERMSPEQQADYDERFRQTLERVERQAELLPPRPSMAPAIVLLSFMFALGVALGLLLGLVIS